MIPFDPEEIEAMEEAQLDEEAQSVGEFFPLVGPDGLEPDDGWRWV